MEFKIKEYNESEVYIFEDVNETQLDLTNLQDKKAIYIKQCHNIVDIDLSQLPQLEKVDIAECSSLKTINLSHNPKLLYFDIYKCNVKNIDVSNNLELLTFRCAYNHLDSLDLSHNKHLKHLKLFDNALTQLDITHNKELELLRVVKSNLKQLDLSNNTYITQLMLNYIPQLSELNIGEMKNLTYLQCSTTSITKLDLSNLSKLEFLIANNNQLASINLSKCYQLKELELLRNKLTDSLNLINSKFLTKVIIDYNNIESIKLDCAETLTIFCAVNNQLKEPFDFSKYYNLTIIELTGNKEISEVAIPSNFKLNQDPNSKEQPKYFCLVEPNTKVTQGPIKN